MSSVPPPVPDSYNPYQAPVAAVDQPIEFMTLASRWQRLGAALLDGVVIGVIGFFAAILLPMADKNPGLMTLFMILAGCAVLAVIVVNAVGIYRTGQTIGKRLLGIRVVRSNGERCDFARYIFLRWLAIAFIGVIPLIGPLVSLVNLLLIFRDNHRCLHDEFADTIVITV